MANIVDAVLFLSYRAARTNPRESSEIILKLIEESIHYGETSLIQDLLEKVDVTRLSVFSMMTLVRITARLKDAIPHWMVVANVVWDELDRRGHSPQRLLIGLNITR
jgi:hypothetical protein